MPAKLPKPVTRRVRSTKAKSKRTEPSHAEIAEPSHAEIAERAYFIYLQDGGSDELENWVRAERELTAA